MCVVGPMSARWRTGFGAVYSGVVGSTRSAVADRCRAAWFWKPNQWCSSFRAGATERPSGGAGGHFLVCGLQGLQGPRGAGIRDAVWPVASASCCFRCGCVVEWQVEQHGALATLVDEVGPGLVVVFSDGCHDGDDLSITASSHLGSRRCPKPPSRPRRSCCAGHWPPDSTGRYHGRSARPSGGSPPATGGGAPRVSSPFAPP